MQSVLCSVLKLKHDVANTCSVQPRKLAGLSPVYMVIVELLSKKTEMFLWAAKSGSSFCVQKRTPLFWMARMCMSAKAFLKTGKGLNVELCQLCEGLDSTGA